MSTRRQTFIFNAAEAMPVIEIPSGQFIPGKFPSGKLKLVQAWIEIRKDK